MARIPYFDCADLPPEHQDLLNRPINLFRALVNSPGAARGWSGIGHYIRHGSKLDPRLRELAILQVGYVARSPYEYSHHIKIGRDFGVSDDDIRAIAAETQAAPLIWSRWPKPCSTRLVKWRRNWPFPTPPSRTCAKNSTTSASPTLS
jgi:alkylhydroperoxidase/carboxymuconolactone decarboxylase family protein YurZ